MNNWEIEGWSYPDKNMIHITLTDGSKRISKTYSQKKSFYNFMHKHDLFAEAIEVALKVWN